MFNNDLNDSVNNQLKFRIKQTRDSSIVNIPSLIINFFTIGILSSLYYEAYTHDINMLPIEPYYEKWLPSTMQGISIWISIIGTYVICGFLSQMIIASNNIRFLKNNRLNKNAQLKSALVFSLCVGIVGFIVQIAVIALTVAAWLFQLKFIVIIIQFINIGPLVILSRIYKTFGMTNTSPVNGNFQGESYFDGFDKTPYVGNYDRYQNMYPSNNNMVPNNFPIIMDPNLIVPKKSLTDDQLSKLLDTNKKLVDKIEDLETKISSFKKDSLDSKEDTKQENVGVL